MTTRLTLFCASLAIVLLCQACTYNPNTLYSAVQTDEMPKEAFNLNVQMQSEAGAVTFQSANFQTEPVSLSRPEVALPVPFSTARLYQPASLTSVLLDRDQVSPSSQPYAQQRLGAELSLSVPSGRSGLGFDVRIAPRLTMLREGDFRARRLGGELQIGQTIDQRGDGSATHGWYLFAGADGEAFIWEPDSQGAMSFENMALRDKVTVGDVQAGVSFQRGGGQLSLSYIRREVEYRERNLGASESEDFAGVTFTIRR